MNHCDGGDLPVRVGRSTWRDSHGRDWHRWRLTYKRIRYAGSVTRFARVGPLSLQVSWFHRRARKPRAWSQHPGRPW